MHNTNNSIEHNTVYYVLKIIIYLIYIFFKYIRKYTKDKFDVVIVSTPPLPLSILGKMIKKKFGSKFIYGGSGDPQ